MLPCVPQNERTAVHHNPSYCPTPTQHLHHSQAAPQPAPWQHRLRQLDPHPHTQPILTFQGDGVVVDSVAPTSSDLIARDGVGQLNSTVSLAAPPGSFGTKSAPADPVRPTADPKSTPYSSAGMAHTVVHQPEHSWSYNVQIQTLQPCTQVLGGASEVQLRCAHDATGITQWSFVGNPPPGRANPAERANARYRHGITLAHRVFCCLPSVHVCSRLRVHC